MKNKYVNTKVKTILNYQFHVIDRVRNVERLKESEDKPTQIVENEKCQESTKEKEST